VTLDSVKLGSVAQVLNGHAFKSKEYVDDGIRIVRITNVQKGRIQDDAPKFVAIHRSDEFARFMLDEGDILISLTGNVGRVGVIEASMLPAALNQRVGALKLASENVAPDYLFHVLNSNDFEQAAIKNSKGIAQLNLSAKWIEAYRIPLPPLAEQKRIAGILDAADALRAKRRESLAQLDTLLQSTFLEMFGDPVTNPMGWEVRDLGHIAKFINGDRGKNYPSKTDFVDAGIPFINAGHLRDGKVDFDDMNYITQGSYDRLGSGKAVPGDILYCLRGSLGKAAISRRKGCAAIASSLVIIRPCDELCVEYLFEYLVSPFGREEIRKFDNGSSQPNLSATSVKKYRVLIPPIVLQHRFAAIVESVEQQKASQRAHLEELDTLFASLQSRAFNGDL
jgi:type I restriction enzyme, S subunit